MVDLIPSKMKGLCTYVLQLPERRPYAETMHKTCSRSSGAKEHGSSRRPIDTEKRIT